MSCRLNYLLSLRIRHVADLPPLMRAYAASVLAHAPVVPRAATQLGLATRDVETLPSRA